ncbi:MAG: DUF705 domain-containing protein [Gammaproteobacteria bacterium]|nr:MAG: DUF705 domain-containing protein [Gammaproteobacteria bacterium]
MYNTNFKLCIVFDLDETLVFVKGKDIYVRPYAESAMHILSRRDSNILILWSTGDLNYVYNVLTRLNWCHYFRKILTRDDCEMSLQRYGDYKSSLYVSNLLKYDTLGMSVKYVLIDDLALENESKNLYDMKISIVPYKPGPDLHLYNAVKHFV